MFLPMNKRTFFSFKYFVTLLMNDYGMLLLVLSLYLKQSSLLIIIK